MSSDTFPKTALRLIRALAIIAFACSAYLLYQKVSGNYDSCCGAVLDSRWSGWFGIPVSVFACALYLAIFIASLPSSSRPRPLPFAGALLIGAVIATGAALWFFALLMFAEKTSCPYCIATHVCGLALSGIVFAIRRSMPALPPTGFAAAGAALLLMVVGQVSNKGGANMEITSSGVGDAANPDATPRQLPDQIVFNPFISIPAGMFPTIGPEEPKHVIGEMFDYTCKSCRTIYGDLKALDAAYPGTFEFIYIPTPLHRNCNAFLPGQIHDHQHACELAKIALAVWSADKSKFAEFHHTLMTTPLPILPSDAEAKAISLVGEASFREALRSPTVAGALTSALGHYATTVAQSPKMPKLLLKGANVLHGPIGRDRAHFLSLIAKHFGLE